jgi:hypothetical protein
MSKLILALATIGTCATSSPAQQVIWVATSEDWQNLFVDTVWDVAADGAGGVYAAGSGAWYELMLARFDADGNALWGHTFGHSPVYDALHGVSADGADGVVVAGTQGTFGSLHVWAGRFDAEGQQCWGGFYNQGLEAIGHDVIPDGLGGAFVVGMVGHAYVSHIDAGGDMVWFALESDEGILRYDGAAPDGFGGFFAAGRAWHAEPDGVTDAIIVHYDADGRILDSVQFGNEIGDDAILGLEPDGEGGVICCGYTPTGPPAHSAAFVARFDENLDQTWIHVSDSLGDDRFEAVQPTESGDLLVAGVTSGDLFAPNAGGDDIIVARIDADGVVWSWQVGSDEDDWAYGIAPDDAGGVYVGGATFGDLFGADKFGFGGFLLRLACPADCNADGALNILDFVCFQTRYQAGDPAADCNADDVLNILDFVCFQGLFQAGCS